MSNPEEQIKKHVWYRVPLIYHGVCRECGESLHNKDWLTCSTCGKAICVDCSRKHMLICMALTWGLAKKDPVTGELIKEERPRTLSW